MDNADRLPPHIEELIKELVGAAPAHLSDVIKAAIRIVYFAGRSDGSIEVLERMKERFGPHKERV